jgi:UDP-galactopyranose mutase
MRYDIVVVGAGCAGAVVAERIASQAGLSILVLEKRPHIGGNAYDNVDETGIFIQKYGPHIFHTNNRRVFQYLSQFAELNKYEHRVLAEVRGKRVYLPIGIETLEKLYDRSFTRETATEFLNKRRVHLSTIRNARDMVVSQVGEELYTLFFEKYTFKQWGIAADELDTSVTARLPVRLNRDTRYFLDAYQGLPLGGFTAMFRRMLSHPNIELRLNVDYKPVIDLLDYNTLVYTGPIDYFFDYKYGVLPYRSLTFRFETLDTERCQESGVVNFPNEHDYTRITEFKHLYMQKHEKTTICYEYPAADGSPYYPIPNHCYRDIYRLYAEEASRLDNVYFVGRLAEYRYMNMDEAMASALELSDFLLERYRR